MSAICAFCSQEMTHGVGCTVETYDDFDDGVERERIPYGHVREHWEEHSVPPPQKDGRACHDCNVIAEQLHHPGCDMKRCPCCEEQAISCGCAAEEAIST